MKKDSVVLRSDRFLASAALAAHAKADGLGFRQRDVRFLLELFTNWMASTLGEEALNISNTQVLRFLNALTADGFARTNRRSKQPVYTLTRVGLLELAARAAAESKAIQPRHFYFLFYFVQSYRPKIYELIEKEGKLFPLAVRMDLNALLDERELLGREIKRVENEMTRLQSRMSDATQAAKLARKLFQQNTPQDDVFLKIEDSFPYELNSQVPLSELLLHMPPTLARWEMETGNVSRVDIIWEPSLSLLKNYRETLKKIQFSHCS